MSDRFEELARAAEALDAADPLAGWRARFHLPDGLIYLDGHSLGPLPRATAGQLAASVHDDWGGRLIAGWNEAGWIDLPATVGAVIAPLVGADADEVIACDSVSVNLFKLGHAALRLAGGRRIVLAEDGDFPTDAQVLEGLCALHGATLIRLPRADIPARLGPDVALLALSHVHYRTAARWDLPAVTAAARAAGALMLWDLSHSTGAVELDLKAAGADFAVGCGYKYLNGGPGAPAFAFVARRHHARLETPIRGWMGHEAPFAFEDRYRPAPGVRRLLAGTPPILSLVALHRGAAMVAEAGVARLAAKARALARLFCAALEAIGDPAHSIETPAEHHGAHVTVRHREAWGIVRALADAGVVGDYREPQGARFGFSPMIVRHADAVAAARALAQVLARRCWADARRAARPAVT